jgi:hypothetical protein
LSSPGVGFNPLAFAAPDLYAKQIGIARRQALGQALLQGGSGDPGRAAFGGLRNAGNALMGALLLKNSDRDMAALYSPPEDSVAGPGQVSNSPQAPPQAMAQPKMTGEYDPEGNPVFAAPQTQQAVTQQPDTSHQYGMGYGNAGQTSQSQDKPRSLPEALARMVVPIPGLTRQASTQYYLTDPKGYYQALAAATSPTPDQKNAGAAYGYGTPQAAQAVRGIVDKAGSVPVSRGMVRMPDGSMIFAPPAPPAGYQYVQGPYGQPMLVETPGGPDAVAGSTYASNYGKAAATPAVGFDANNMPVPTSQAQMLGNAPLGIRTNNPGNLQPGGKQATYGTPAEGVIRAASNLDAYAARTIRLLTPTS